jgi:hypothetical protein
MPAVTGTIYDGRQADFGYIKVVTDATVDDGDTIAVDLSEYGASGIDFILGWIHSTTDSVLVAEQPTTSVTSGVLTITVGGSTDNKKRTYLVGLTY